VAPDCIRHASNRDLDKITPGITVLPMTTMTFKIEDEEAAEIREYAKSLGITVSEYLRTRVRVASATVPRTVTAKYSGAPVFEGHPSYLPLTNESVKEMLSDFP